MILSFMIQYDNYQISNRGINVAKLRCDLGKNDKIFVVTISDKRLSNSLKHESTFNFIRFQSSEFMSSPMMRLSFCLMSDEERVRVQPYN